MRIGRSLSALSQFRNGGIRNFSAGDKPDIIKPLSLYRKIVRAHRALPSDMRTLGSLYARSEFKQHKDVTNAYQVVAFLTEWQKYLDNMVSNQWQNVQALDSSQIDRLPDDKVGQLHELMQAAREVRK
ncbi:Sdh7 protein [Starmerella bacillaris]|uniref:Succinate dehydrogenase assembly factor 3 n=1 Tax=Starmerella bacillaris TaxID=1247836 RepID=A0AAV5RCA9_STABA|nr:Sdh7 protein [Starmerella bacillaris]